MKKLIGNKIRTKARGASSPAQDAVTKVIGFPGSSQVGREDQIQLACQDKHIDTHPRQVLHDLFEGAE